MLHYPIVAAWFINWQFFASAIGYLALQLIYSLVLKRLFLVDLIAIGLGFVLRGVAGALAIVVSVSPWLIIGVFLMALVLTLAKRKEELGSMGYSAEQHRNTLSQHDTETIGRMLDICVTALFVCYLLYASSFQHSHMLVTAPFAVYCIFRYLYILHAKNVGERAERILLDRPMLIALAMWTIAIAMILTLWKE